MVEEGKEFTKEEKIAYHQGCLNTLIGERNELMKILQITENLLQGHMKELEGLGVKFQKGKSE